MSRKEATVKAATSASEAVTPHSLVTEDNVRAALTADKGPSARLTQCKVVDFTKRGDNYACVVSSVEVKYEIEGVSSEVVYVVKLNPCKKDAMTEFLNDIFYEKEAKFYSSLAPALNAVLKENNQRYINVPKCLHVNLEKGKEIIFLEDLRPQGYKMHEFTRPMDTFHTSLVLKELARLHAASLLLENKYSGEDLRKIYPFLTRNSHDMMAESQELLKFLKDSITLAKDMLTKVGGYERAVAWIDVLISQLVDIFYTQLECGKPRVVCHGDCWNNNLLFKYDEAGHPVDVMLLDLQVVRYTPPAIDLSYFLYSATTGDFRKLNLQSCLKCYHGALSDIMEAAGQEIPFDMEQFTKDFREKTLYGAIFGIMAAPVSILKTAEEMMSSKSTDESTEEMLNKAKAYGMDTLHSNPMLRPRLLSLLDEMMELGLIT